MAKERRARNTPSPYRFIQLEHLESRLLLTILPIAGAPDNRDFILDSLRGQLYITTSTNVLRYDFATQSLATPFPDINLSPGRGDISPDGAYLYLSKGASIQRIDLATGALTGFSIGDLQARDLVIANDNRAYVVGRDPGGESARIVNLSNFSYFEPTFAANEGPAAIFRSADRSVVKIIAGPFGYSSTDVTLIPTNTQQSPAAILNNASAAVSPNGSLYAVDCSSGIVIKNLAYTTAAVLSNLHGGLSFDPVKPLLYVADPATDRITAFNTSTWASLYTFDIGEDLTSVGPYANGQMLFNSDASTLYLATSTGLRSFATTRNNWSATVSLAGPSTAFAGASTTWTVSVSPNDPNAGATQPTGRVHLLDSGVEISQTSLQPDGTAAFSCTFSTTGTHTLTARYDGDDNFAYGPTSADQLLDVNKVSTTLTPSATALAITYAQGAPLVFTLKDAFNNPVTTGSVSLRYVPTGAILLTKPVQSDGTVTFTLIGQVPGTYQYAGDYLPSSAYTASSSSPISLTISQASPTLTASFISNTLQVTAAFAAGLPGYTSAPTGTVLIADNGTPFSTLTLANGSASVAINLPLSVGVHTFTCSYAGDANYTSAQASPLQLGFAPTVTFIPSPGTVSANTPINLLAQLSDPVPGTMAFYNGAQLLGTAPVVGTRAALAITLPIGSHTLSAKFTPADVVIPAQTSSTAAVAVIGIPTSISLTSSKLILLAGQSLTLTAAVTPASPGSVQFFDNGAAIGTAQVAGNQATLSLAASLGTHNFSAKFVPTSASYAASTTASSLLVTANQPTVIDLLALYSVQAWNLGVDLLARIKRAVDDTNVAFANSGIPATLRLVGIAPANYAETNDLPTDLQRLYTPNDGYMDNAPSLRNYFGADLTALFVSRPSTSATIGFETVGIATELYNPASSTRAEDSYLVVAQSSYDQYVLAHEVGHTLGAAHALGDDSDSGATSYAHGYRFYGNDGVQYHDIMAYDPGTQIPYFSNPAISYQGVPIGTVSTANAARVLRDNAPVVATYRASPKPFGALDAVSYKQLRGWALDPKLLFGAAQVRIDIDGITAATIAANVSRTDLNAFVGSSDHGFTYDLPALAEGNHTVAVYVLDAETGAATLLASRTVNAPSLLFDETWYLNHNPDVNAAVQQGLTTAWDHFRFSGQFELRSPSAYFDTGWYLAKNPDIAAAYNAKAIPSPYWHYANFGQFENRIASPFFDPHFYRLAYPDIDTAIRTGALASALGHFLANGRYEGRNPIPFFDTAAYKLTLALNNATYTTPYDHFLQSGDAANLAPSAWFDPATYLQLNTDLASPLAALKLSPFDHFIRWGFKEGRPFSTTYSEKAYLAKNPDVANAVKAGIFTSGFEHWVLFGRRENRVTL